MHTDLDANATEQTQINSIHTKKKHTHTHLSIDPDRYEFNHTQMHTSNPYTQQRTLDGQELIVVDVLGRDGFPHAREVPPGLVVY